MDKILEKMDMEGIQKIVGYGIEAVLLAASSYGTYHLFRKREDKQLYFEFYNKQDIKKQNGNTLGKV
jgi:hypothetical protein